MTITLLIHRNFRVFGLFGILLAAGLTNSRAQNTWTQKSDFGGTGRYGSVGFSIDGKGYLGTGYNGAWLSDFWEYDPTGDAWTQKANFGGGVREFAVGFSIGSKGYVGTGNNVSGGNGKKNDFWEFNPLSNTWTQKSNFGGTARWMAVGFSIADKGYLGTGNDGSYKTDFWEYDPITDTWTQKTDFGGTARYQAVGFSIGIKGYIGTGSGCFHDCYSNDFWEYDPNTDTWTQKANVGGPPRYAVAGFSINGKGYIGTGDTAVYATLKDFWEYDPDMDTWTQKADFAGTDRQWATGFAIGNKGYVGLGRNSDGFYNKDFWEYSPDTLSCAEPTNLSVVAITSSSVKLSWTDDPGTTGYVIRYKISSTNNWMKVHAPNNFKTITGLSPGTEYTWQVKRFCQFHPIISSNWSASQIFTTLPQKLADESLPQLLLGIYPNPADQNFTVSLQSINEGNAGILLVVDMLGRIIYERKILIANGELQQEIQLNDAEAGMYLIKVIVNSDVYTKQLVISH